LDRPRDRPKGRCIMGATDTAVGSSPSHTLEWKTAARTALTWILCIALLVYFIILIAAEFHLI
ncbi:MAG: hypothetical protein OET79_12250, partial [Nitrospirota bacterium]|nr:hypothetical protein [Nitrospirota bacterium]